VVSLNELSLNFVNMVKGWQDSYGEGMKFWLQKQNDVKPWLKLKFGWLKLKWRKRLGSSGQ
jgi:hypothetical protein